MPYIIPTTTTVSDEIVQQVIESAGYGIGYWAESAEIDDDANTYTVTPQDEFVSDYPAKALTFADIATALVAVADGRANVHDYIASYAASALRDDDAGDIDSDVADVTIQFAMFGTIVFG